MLRRYLKETKRPIYSAALVLPFFLIYHGGILFLRTTYINGADALIMRILSLLSVNTVFSSALVLILTFVVWQVRTKASWKLHAPKLALMFLECFLFAVTLFFLLGWFSIHLATSLAPPEASAPMFRGTHGRVVELVLYCGAGIYEELLFRGLLLGGLLLLLTNVLGMKKTLARVWAAVLAGLLFSLFHFVGPTGDSFTIQSFLQRLFAGLYFSALFVGRGFGSAAASHALYDILVGLARP